MRIGIGYDIHPLKKGLKLVLGGVPIRHSMGLAGHSDADALLHAILDAVLGAMGDGDIGELFPDTDKRFKGVSSLIFAAEVLKRLRKKKLSIGHIDSTVIAQAPRLSPYKVRMRETIARAFGLTASRVGVKAKTNEGFGSVGRKRAIMCLAVVSLKEVRR